MADVPLYFETQQGLRDWFVKNAQYKDSLLVGFYKTSTKIPSINMEQACDEALCVGWQDISRQTLDAKRYTVRFARRKPNTIWTDLHIKRIAILVAQNKIYPAGIAIFKLRKHSRAD